MGNEAANSYSLADSTLVVGVPLKGAFGKSEMISIKQKTEGVTAEESVDGSVVFVIKRTGLFEVTITVTQASSNNQKLTAVYQAQQAGGPAVPVIWKQNLNGFVCQTSMISKMPDVKRSGGVEDQAWTLLCADGVLALVGG